MSARAPGPRLAVTVVGTLVLALLGPGRTAAVAAPVWEPVADVSTPGSESNVKPVVALDGAGNATVVWLQGSGNDEIVQAAYRPAGAPWGAPVTLSDRGLPAAMPTVSVSPSGHTAVAWRRSNGNHFVIQAVTRAAGQPWSGVTDVSARGGSATTPAITVDLDGAATLVWSRNNGTDTVVQAAARPAGGAWTAAVDLSAPGALGWQPVVTSDASGLATAVWLRQTGGRDAVQSASRPRGGSWSPVTTLTPPAAQATGPQVATDGAGSVTAVWYARAAAPGWIAQSAVRTAGTWSNPVDISAPGREALYPQLAVNRAGAAAVVWFGSDGSGLAVQAASRSATGVWSPPVDLSTPGESAARPAVALDDLGVATAVWEESTGIQVAQRGAETPWSVPVVISDALNQTFAPHVATGAGDVVAAWHSSRSIGRVVSARVLPRPVPPGGGPGPAAQAATALTAPRIVRVGLNPRRISRTGTSAVPQRTRLVVVLTTAATVRVTLRRAGSAGRRANLVRVLPAGRSRIVLTTRIRQRLLMPGNYRLTVLATNAAGRSTAQTRLVVRP